MLTEMKTYYYNTTAQKKNVLVGYLSHHGDFINASDSKKFSDEIFAKIVTEDTGLLTAGETLDSYYARVACAASKHFNL